MDLSVALAVAGAAWWALTCAIRIGSSAAAFLEPRRRERAATRRDQPPVSIIIPVRRLEADAAAAFGSAYAQAYPRIEVITAAEETSSPALDLARELAQRFPRVESRVLGGPPRPAVCR